MCSVKRLGYLLTMLVIAEAKFQVFTDSVTVEYAIDCTFTGRNSQVKVLKADNCIFRDCGVVDVKTVERTSYHVQHEIKTPIYGDYLHCSAGQCYTDGASNCDINISYANSNSSTDSSESESSSSESSDSESDDDNDSQMFVHREGDSIYCCDETSICMDDKVKIIHGKVYKNI